MRAELVRRFGAGDLIACSALQDGLSWMDCSYGAWPYRRVWGIDVTLGGPLCDPSDRPAMIERFLSRSRRPILCYLRDDVVRALDGAGLASAGMGVDKHVDLPAFLASPAKEVQGALRKSRRARFAMREIDLGTLDSRLRARLREINARYLAQAECTREMSFLNRPMSYEADGLRRVFLLEKHDREHDGAFGFAVLNPIFDRARTTGYLLDLLRFEPTRLWGVWPSAVHTLAAQLASEGMQMSLGLAPLHRVRHPASASRVLSAQMDGLVRLVSSAAYLRRLRELKDLVPGAEEPRSFASFSRSVLTNVFAFLEALDVRFSYLFGPDLLKVLGAGLRAA